MKVNGTHISVRSISVGNFGVYFGIFRLGKPKQPFHLHSSRNFRIFLVNGRHSICRKIPEFRNSWEKIKWYSNFPEIPLGNFGVPLEVPLSSRSEREVAHFSRFQSPV